MASELYHPVKIRNLELGGNIFLAPVAGYSDRSFRSICVKYGASFTYTEMVSAEALTRNNVKTEELMRRAQNEKAYSVQIFGGNAEKMAEAARIVFENTKCECIDINCGCPVPKIIRSGAGACLTREPKLLGKIAKAVVDATKDYENPPVVTVKIRSGWDNQNITYKDAAEEAINAGCSAITLHSRTRAQGYEGFADWEKLADLVQFVNRKVCVFGSGDLWKPEDAKRMIEQTDCDGVMFARGAMGNPFIFEKTISLLKTGSYKEISISEKIKTAFEELDLLTADTNEKHACLEMRKRFCAYTKGIQGGAAFREKTIHAVTIQDYHNIFDGVL